MFVLNWDDCAFGETYKNKQALVTNAPFLTALGKDCPGHSQHTVRSHSDMSLRWCQAYAGLLKSFVKDPVDKRCVHCLPTGPSRQSTGRRETLRRCAERVSLPFPVDDWDFDVAYAGSEVCLKARLHSKAALTASEHPGARCVAPLFFKSMLLELW